VALSSEMGLPEYEAKRYEGRVKQGGILLSVHSDNSDWTRKAKDGEEKADFSRTDKPMRRASIVSSLLQSPAHDRGAFLAALNPSDVFSNISQSRYALKLIAGDPQATGFLVCDDIVISQHPHRDPTGSK